MHDAKLGRLLFVVLTALFAYISLWLLVTPFIEPQHLALALFPPIQLAFLPFCVAGVLLLSIVTGYTGVLLINEGLQGLRPSAATT